MNWTQKDIEAAMDKIEELAATDMEFRKLCLTNPAEAIKKATGKEIPADFKVKFIENEGVQETFVLPDFKGGQELSVDDLESVAGGGTKHQWG